MVSVVVSCLDMFTSNQIKVLPLKFPLIKCICVFQQNSCLGQSGPDLTFQIRVKRIVLKESVALESKKEPPEPSMIGHKLLMWSCRGCLCLSVHHSGTCGFSYRMFYCSTMFLPWSSAHCIKTTLSPDAHTGRVRLIVHTCTRRVMMTSARQ